MEILNSAPASFDVTQADLPVAVVTGASSGIGLATAQAFVRAGYRCFGLARNLPNGTGGPAAKIEWIQTDIRSDESVAQAISSIQKAAGRIDVLVNNAGIGLIAASEESSTTQLQGLFETNVFGLIRMSHAVLPIMRRQRNGRILQVSSVAGFVPTPYMALYTATKHAVEGYAESLDHELREFGVRSLLIQPGFTRSAIHANAPTPDVPLAAFRRQRERFSDFILANESRAGSAQAVANLILKVAQAENPPTRSRCGIDAHLLHLLRRFLPAFLFDKLLRAQFKLPA